MSEGETDSVRPGEEDGEDSREELHSDALDQGECAPGPGGGGSRWEGLWVLLSLTSVSLGRPGGWEEISGAG